MRKLSSEQIFKYAFLLIATNVLQFQVFVYFNGLNSQLESSSPQHSKTLSNLDPFDEIVNKNKDELSSQVNFHPHQTCNYTQKFKYTYDQELSK